MSESSQVRNWLRANNHLQTYLTRPTLEPSVLVMVMVLSASSGGEWECKEEPGQLIALHDVLSYDLYGSDSLALSI